MGSEMCIRDRSSLLASAAPGVDGATVHDAKTADPSGSTLPTLMVPASPRYFITATKKTLTRSSYHLLPFPNEAALNQAYLLLNSGLTYWWWRVMDGG